MSRVQQNEQTSDSDGFQAAPKAAQLARDYPPSHLKPEQRQLLQNALCALVQFLPAKGIDPRSRLEACRAVMQNLSHTDVLCIPTDAVDGQGTRCKKCGLSSQIIGYQVCLAGIFQHTYLAGPIILADQM